MRLIRISFPKFSERTLNRNHPLTIYFLKESSTFLLRLISLQVSWVMRLRVLTQVHITRVWINSFSVPSQLLIFDRNFALTAHDIWNETGLVKVTTDKYTDNLVLQLRHLNFNLNPSLVLNPAAPRLLDPSAIFQGADVLAYGVHISIVYELLWPSHISSDLPSRNPGHKNKIQFGAARPAPNLKICSKVHETLQEFSLLDMSV